MTAKAPDTQAIFWFTLSRNLSCSFNLTWMRAKASRLSGLCFGFSNPLMIASIFVSMRTRRLSISRSRASLAAMSVTPQIGFPRQPLAEDQDQQPVGAHHEGNPPAHPRGRGLPVRGKLSESGSSAVAAHRKQSMVDPQVNEHGAALCVANLNPRSDSLTKCPKDSGHYLFIHLVPPSITVPGLFTGGSFQAGGRRING